MGYGGSMSGGSSRPENISREEWKALMDKQDAQCHEMISLYIKFIFIVIGTVCFVITIASFIWGSGMKP